MIETPERSLPAPGRRGVRDALARVRSVVFHDLENNGGGQGRRPVAGLLWVVTAMFMLACLTAIGRHAALEGLDPFQVMFFRNMFCVIWMLPLLLWRGRSLVATSQLRIYGLRVGLSFIAMSGMFHAIALIGIGDVTAIGFLAPIFGTVFAVLLLGEVVGWRRWTALAAGFLGAMVILRPGMGDTAIGAGAGLALMSAMAMGLIGPLVKSMTVKDDPDRVVFLTNVFLTPVSLVPALFVWQWPSLELLGWLAVMGFAAVIGHMALVRGYAATDASLVMTYKFSRLPFAVAVGYLAFSETIDGWAWLGAFIVFASSAYIARREQLLAKAATAQGKRPVLGGMDERPPLG